MKIAPSTRRRSIAATISSPVTCSGQFGTVCQGRLGVFASYAWTWESMIVTGDAPQCWGSSLSQQVASAVSRTLEGLQALRVLSPEKLFASLDSEIRTILRHPRLRTNRRTPATY